MPSFCCYDNSEVIEILIITTFHIYLRQLWWEFCQTFVYGDVVDTQTWEVFTLKNPIELPFPAKHRAESFEFCLLILFLEDSAIFSLYLQTVVNQLFQFIFTHFNCGRTSTCLHHSNQHPCTASTVVYIVTFINIINITLMAGRYTVTPINYNY